MSWTLGAIYKKVNDAPPLGWSNANISTQLTNSMRRSLQTELHYYYNYNGIITYQVVQRRLRNSSYDEVREFIGLMALYLTMGDITPNFGGYNYTSHKTRLFDMDRQFRAALRQRPWVRANQEEFGMYGQGLTKVDVFNRLEARSTPVAGVYNIELFTSSRLNTNITEVPFIVEDDFTISEGANGEITKHYRDGRAGYTRRTFLSNRYTPDVLKKRNGFFGSEFIFYKDGVVLPAAFFEGMEGRHSRGNIALHYEWNRDCSKTASARVLFV